MRSSLTPVFCWPDSVTPRRQQKGSHFEHRFVCRGRTHSHARRLLRQQVFPPHLVRFAYGRADAEGHHCRARKHILRRTSRRFFNILDYVKNASLKTSAMSKIRRPSLFIPNPKAFVRSVLAKLAPGTITPYWTHALVGAAMRLAPPKMVLAYVHSLQKDIRRRALAKQARLAKQE